MCKVFWGPNQWCTWGGSRGQIPPGATLQGMAPWPFLLSPLLETAWDSSIGGGRHPLKWCEAVPRKLLPATITGDSALWAWRGWVSLAAATVLLWASFLPLIMWDRKEVAQNRWGGAADWLPSPGATLPRNATGATIIAFPSWPMSWICCFPLGVHLQRRIQWFLL